MEKAEPVFLELDSGIGIITDTTLKLDWAGIRLLVESGVPMAEVARHYKITTPPIRRKAREEAWLTPTRVERLRKEVAKRQSESFRRSGKAANVSEVKAEIWEERGERMKEEAYRIARKALGGVTDAEAARMIRNPKGLLEMVQVTRLVTGEEDRAVASGTQLAVNIGMLRIQRPEDAGVIDV